MGHLILADIHGNVEALRAVLEDAQEAGPLDQVWCLGDIVGYGPDPGPCIELLRCYDTLAVAGNHDLAAVGLIPLDTFNANAREAAEWTAGQLSGEQREYLAALPRRLEVDGFTLVHGSPREPVWEYFHPMFTPIEAIHDSFLHFRTPFCLVGHTHIPIICKEMGPTFSRFPEGEPVPLAARERLVVNPGGVGQPRDGDPRPSYVIYDPPSGTLLRRRAVYDIEATQRKMRRAGLPELLAGRLSYGR